MTAENQQSEDLLYGYGAIAAYLNLRIRQAKHIAEKQSLPTFKIGKTVCARRSTLSAWLAEQEMTAQQKL
jgi:hypothetical protein